MTPFQRARKVADAVLYEGYVLYPYRASSGKNQLRWTFGVLAPREWCAAGGCENSFSRTECLVEAGPDAKIFGKVRFLQLQRRSIEEALGAGDAFGPVAELEVDGNLYTAWDEGHEREIEFEAPLNGGETALFELGGGREVQELRAASGRLAGRLIRERWPVAGEIRMTAERVDPDHLTPPGGLRPVAGKAGSSALLKLSIVVENVSPWADVAAPRDEALRSALTGAHVLLAVEGGSFVSLLEPGETARAAAAACKNLRTWPVLIGPAPRRDLILSSPIILYDYPEVAKESPGDLYDATEIDEILTLRTQCLTEDEKRQARATDPRAAAILDRVDSMPGEMLEKLHGAVRSLREPQAIPDAITCLCPAGSGPSPAKSAPPIPGAAWWDPGADASVNPDTDAVEVAGVRLAKGSTVRLRPSGRADAQDMFLEGKLAQVQGVFLDVEDRSYLAVTLQDDPGAELQLWHGRYYYFAPAEVEPA